MTNETDSSNRENFFSQSRRELNDINREYERLAVILGDIEAKLAILGQKKQAVLARIFELDAEAGSLNEEQGR